MDALLNFIKNNLLALFFSLLFAITVYTGIQLFYPRPLYPMHPYKNYGDEKLISKNDEEKEAFLKADKEYEEKIVLYNKAVKSYSLFCFTFYIGLMLFCFLLTLTIQAYVIKLGHYYALFMFYIMSFLNAPASPFLNFGYALFALLVFLASLLYQEKIKQS